MKPIIEYSLFVLFVQDLQNKSFGLVCYCGLAKTGFNTCTPGGA